MDTDDTDIINDRLVRPKVLVSWFRSIGSEARYWVHIFYAGLF